MDLNCYKHSILLCRSGMGNILVPLKFLLKLTRKSELLKGIAFSLTIVIIGYAMYKKSWGAKISY